ncbi:hypothetical protein [Actinoplanes sp. GCM10030250]|uniref:hypothetical protein n=1 Tax=Actinoplanes sp. GCM10030250 TaxID=3273376 RepID=UPI0036231DDF
MILAVGGVTVGGVRNETVSGAELDRLLQSDENARRQWLDRRRAVGEEPNWWLHLLLLIDQRWDDRAAERAAWTQLKIWVLAQARRALGQGEVAERTAYYVSQMRNAGMAESALPSADILVRACLDAIAVPIDQVALLTDRKDIRTLERQALLDSRRARHLINAAEPHLPYLNDPALSHQLRAWLAIKPRLV